MICFFDALVALNTRSSKQSSMMTVEEEIQKRMRGIQSWNVLVQYFTLVFLVLVSITSLAETRIFHNYSLHSYRYF